MTAEYEVRFDPVALEALREAADYIRDEAGADRATDWLEAMRGGIGRLETHPQAYSAVTLRRGRPVRSKLVGKHRVFYLIDEIELVVYVIDIVHTARESRLGSYRDE